MSRLKFLKRGRRRRTGEQAVKKDNHRRLSMEMKSWCNWSTEMRNRARPIP